jgi:hypothetical protein
MESYEIEGLRTCQLHMIHERSGAMNWPSSCDDEQGGLG